ncbi:type VI secretion system protein VasD [Natronocella acetinitrilica]|uniref:Type VI secretion system protein VasD n=1 Tax=Natronocella acetinitrilica TaxID=414046 RepID=A0AAE3KAT0_9GAMM|nr:type VI secretion system lipoprotein TssJ [Natronocella acetinitrilica]MCP1673924.1 type VI secretion system protein VasD [Natronocella acetinitrilica]
MTGLQNSWRRGALMLGLCCAALAMLAACASGSGSRPDAVDGRILVGPGLNPNVDGRPSPVYIRVYQLRDRDTFMDASLQELLTRDVDTLGGALLSRDSFELCPIEMEDERMLDGGVRCQGEEREVTLDIYPDVRFLAVMAEFYDVNNPATQWRAVTELPREGFWDFIRSNSFTITLDRSRVGVSFD